MMFDIVINHILQIPCTIATLPVPFSSENMSESLRYENKWTDVSFLRKLHDNSSINGISICEGISAVDGIIFNWEMFDGHSPKRNTVEN